MSLKASLAGELLLLVGLLAVAWLLYVQQEQLVSLELEVDKLRGAFAPVPAAVTNDQAGVEPAPKPKPRPRKPKASGG